MLYKKINIFLFVFFINNKQSQLITIQYTTCITRTTINKTRITMTRKMRRVAIIQLSSFILQSWAS